MNAARKHFQEQVDFYGNLELINLIDKKGSQGRIGETYTNLIKELQVWTENDFKEE